jgi:hypothetical protein
MKLTIEIDKNIHSFKTKKETDLFATILQFKNLLLGAGYSEEKINGCFEASLEMKSVPSNE